MGSAASLPSENKSPFPEPRPARGRCTRGVPTTCLQPRSLGPAGPSLQSAVTEAPQLVCSQVRCHFQITSGIILFYLSDVPSLPCCRLIKQLQYSQLRSHFKTHSLIPLCEQLDYLFVFLLKWLIPSVLQKEAIFSSTQKKCWDQILP